MTSVSTDRRLGVNSGIAVKVPVKAATTANITLSGERTIDGIACADGDRVLVQNQTAGIDNGVYIVDTGEWARAPDFDGAFDVVQGTLVPVAQGATYGGQVMRITTANPITIGTTSLAFTYALEAATMAYTPTTGVLAGILLTVKSFLDKLGDAGTALGAALIGFLQFGVGAVRTDLQTRGRLVVYAEDFGVKADGVTDDAPALEKAVLAIYTAGGGVLILPRGICILGTLSSDANAHSSYIVPRNGVSIVGRGRGISILKVKSGENARFSASNAPNIIATGQAGTLTNCVFSDFTFDWNGANNLLGGGDTARNNASILTINGALNVTIERINIQQTPGNQCIFIKNDNMDVDPGGNVVIRDIECRDCGSGLVGNVNADHSSVYLMADDSIIENVRGYATQLVNGALYELHGRRLRGLGNKSNWYQRGCWIGSDLHDCTDITVDGDQHNNVEAAFGMSAPTFALNNIRVINSTFRQASGRSFAGVTYFVNGFTLASSDRLEIAGCTFIGTSTAFNRFLQHSKIANLIFERNWVKAFDDATHGFGIVSANGDIGGSLIANRISIQRNKFDNVRFPVSIQPSTLGVTTLDIVGNECSTAGTGTAITVNVNAGVGEISTNKIPAGFTAVVSLSGTNSIWGSDVTKTWTPVLTFATPGDLAVSYATQAGRARKVGNRVYVDFNVVTSAFTFTTASGNLQLTGLPVASSSVSTLVDIGSMFYQGITDATRPHVVPRIVNSSSLITFVGSGSGANASVESTGVVPTGGTVQLIGSISYEAAT